MADDCVDIVSGRRGPGIWRTVAEWLSITFADVEVDLHSAAEEDDSRILVWITLRGTHVGSGFPFMAGRTPTAKPVVWAQLHVFRIQDDRLIEHWAVRDDLRVLKAIDQRD